MLTTQKRVQFLLLFSLGISLVFTLAGCAPAGARALAKGDRLLKGKKYPEAVQKFEEATTAFPKNAEAWNHLAVGYQYAGNQKKSASAFQKALSLNPNLTAARRNLGLLYFEQRNFSAALLELTTFTQLEPKNAEGWFYRGLAEMHLARTSPALDKVRQFESAKRSFDYSQKLHPSAETLNLTGLLQVQRGRVREAIPFFTAALQQQPGFSPAILNLAVTYQHLNERKPALDFYKKFLSIARQAPEISQVRLAIQQLESESASVKKDPTPARIAATNPPPTIATKPVVASNAPPATRTETNFTRPLVAARPPTILSSPKAQPLPQKEIPVVVATLPEEPLIKPASNVIDEVRTVPERSNEAGPAADSVRIAIPPPEKGAGVLTRLNPTTWFRRKPKYTPLTTELPGEKSSVEKPAPTEVIDNLAPRIEVTESAAESKAPIPRYKSRLLSNPPEGKRFAAEPFFARGIQAQKDRKTSDAIAAYREALKMDPRFFEANYNLALVLRETGDLSAALLAYEQALTLQPESVNARYNFAFTLHEAGYFHDAAEELQKLLRENPNETRAHLLLGNICAQRLNQTSTAREHYLKVLEADSRHPQAVQIRYWLAAHP